MIRPQRLTLVKVLKLSSVAMTLSCLLSVVGGCSLSATPSSSSGEKPVISSYSMPAATEESSTSSEAPIVIWQYQDMPVTFNRFSENVGYLNLGISSKENPSYVLNGHYMYSLSGVNGTYELRRIDLDQLDKSAIAKIRVSGGTVALLDFGIRIKINGDTIFYDFSFHEICRAKDIGEEQCVIPYRDGYIVKDGAKLKILHLDEESEYRLLDSVDYEITGYHSTGDNTYLIMKDREHPEIKNRTIYDINRKAYWRRLPENVALSDVGFAGSVSGKYVVGNFAKMKLARYESKNPGILGETLFDGSRIYFLDGADKKMKYYVPTRKNICVLSEAEFLQGASLKGLYNGYVYAQYGTSIYFIDPAGQKEMTGDAYIKKIKSETAKLKSNLEFHYRIKIMNGTTVPNLAKKNATLKPITSDLVTLSTMNRLSAVLKKLNYRFFEVFKQDKKNGLCILLSGNIDVIDGKSGVPGYSFSDQNAYYIALNVFDNDIEMVMSRELMHTIESRLVNADMIFGSWSSLNPEGFAYSEMMAGVQEAPYVPASENDVNNVYFTDPYACASPYEDRARLFAAMLMPEKYGGDINSYPHLADKASAIKHVLLTYYPALSETQIMNGIK